MISRTLAVAALATLTACGGKKDEAAVVDSAAMAPAAAPAVDASAPKDIIETAVAAGTFNTLAKALTAAGLVETLKGAGPYTVLAPTDEGADLSCDRWQRAGLAGVDDDRCDHAGR